MRVVSLFRQAKASQLLTLKRTLNLQKRKLRRRIHSHRHSRTYWTCNLWPTAQVIFFEDPGPGSQGKESRIQEPEQRDVLGKERERIIFCVE